MLVSKLIGCLKSINIPLLRENVLKLTYKSGRAIVQAVSRWLPTAAVHEGFVVDKVALEQVFSEYFGQRSG
jgi:hypothetical protein